MFIINNNIDLFISKKIILRIEPYVVLLESTIDTVIDSVNQLYADYLVLDDESDIFIDFYFNIKKPSVIRGLFQSQVQCYIDSKTPFKPLPHSQAYPFFEWSLNWAVVSQDYNQLIIHAAVLEKEGQALILCGKPGAGKSTLCAALSNRGWRLFSDEMAIVNRHNNDLTPFVRPVSLKNKSIDIIKAFAPDAVMGMSFHDTSKGTVSHMKPSQNSIQNAKIPAPAKWVVFPQYKENSKTLLTPIAKGETVIELAKNAFNYNVLGAQGFNNLCALVDQSDCYNFEYSNLDEAVTIFSNLASKS